MDKLLVICGPTATGKTKIALRLARIFSGELISADSRQVYKGMDIGTGKDLSLIGKIKIWGIDLVGPEKNFSVAQYINITQPILEDILRRKKLPILVGGTGLYIKALVDGIPTAAVPPNKRLRKTLEKKSAGELYEILGQFDSLKAASMNISDRKNPRRLIRGIEIAQAKGERSGKRPRPLSVLFIGLKAPEVYLKKQIRRRTEKMLEDGILTEIDRLLKKGVSWKNQSMEAIGYREWRNYFKKKETDKDRIVEAWIANQWAYAKSQMVWFKRDKRIIWFDISRFGFNQRLEKTVKRWYKTNND